MGSVRVLEAAVVDRIAAGEVVERPASVVKELLENSLDAGGKRITVRVTEGGTRAIEVADDGHGMDPDDARSAFLQHATSKIRTVDDLESIGSLGFRGEALASIASVARVTLTTGTGEGSGFELRVEGGETMSERSVSFSRGTTVRVEDLFYNTPARRKHLRTRATELGRIAAVVQATALARTDVHFELAHDGRERLSAPPVKDLADRVHQIYGSEVSGAWLSVSSPGSRIQVHGGVTGPAHHRPDRRHVHLFANGRPISDGRLAHAVVSAYETMLDAGRNPVAAVFLEVPAGDVDVNVHPRKAEVRFVEPGRVYGAVRRAVMEALAAHLPPATLTGRRVAGGWLGDGRLHGGVGGAGVIGGGRGHAAAEGDLASEQRAVHSSLPLREWHVKEGAPVSPVATAGAIAGTRGAIQPLAQYANTYILAADDDGLLIIDQHVAHERILYEEVLARSRDRSLETQRLLVPETLDLTIEEASVAEESIDLLGSLGFEIEPFGGSTWAVRSVPAALGTRRVEPTLRSLLESLADCRGPEVIEEARKQAAASIACHAAVRANQPLSGDKIAWLVARLAECESPTRCPHGRPVLLRVDHGDLERHVGRA